jgi:hypothetical protein
VSVEKCYKVFLLDGEGLGMKYVKFPNNAGSIKKK